MFRPTAAIKLANGRRTRGGAIQHEDANTSRAFHRPALARLVPPAVRSRPLAARIVRSGRPVIDCAAADDHTCDSPISIIALVSVVSAASHLAIAPCRCPRIARDAGHDTRTKLVVFKHRRSISLNRPDTSRGRRLFSPSNCATSLNARSRPLLGSRAAVLTGSVCGGLRLGRLANAARWTLRGGGLFTWPLSAGAGACDQRLRFGGVWGLVDYLCVAAASVLSFVGTYCTWPVGFSVAAAATWRAHLRRSALLQSL